MIFKQEQKDATHYIECRHCVNRKSCYDYLMYCIPLGKTKTGRMKVLVFGDRARNNKGHIKKIRYIDPRRVIKK